MRHTLAGLALSGILAGGIVLAQTPRKAGVNLGELSWYEAADALTESTVVVIPLGLAASQHGPHLKLDHNERLARYLASRVRTATDVVVAPPLTYHFSPTFLEYPGSTSLSRATARTMTMDVVRSLARYGPRRFYVLNTGLTTMPPLADAATALRDDGVLLGYTDPERYLRGAGVPLQQTTSSIGHADEVETSMMLFVDPSAVDMSKAVREYGPGSGPMTRQKDAPGLFSSTGVFGDATVATREKGRVIVETLVDGVLADVARIRTAALPEPRTAPPAPPPAAARSGRAPESGPVRPNGCTEGDERTIRNFGPRFSFNWAQQDALAISLMFTRMGDMRHPDGYIERSQEIILTNRTDLFKKAEYANSKHNLQLMDIRCLGANTAIADGKWDLSLGQEPKGGGRAGRALGTGRTHKGLCTLILIKPPDGGSWQIEAWRYTVDPPDGVPPPTTLKQPGFLGRGGGH